MGGPGAIVISIEAVALQVLLSDLHCCCASRFTPMIPEPGIALTTGEPTIFLYRQHIAQRSFAANGNPVSIFVNKVMVFMSMSSNMGIHNMWSSVTMGVNPAGVKGGKIAKSACTEFEHSCIHQVDLQSIRLPSPVCLRASGHGITDTRITQLCLRQR